eukprot:scaffold128649_cov17-Tisochrysis_lutea.AAC.2
MSGPWCFATKPGSPSRALRGIRSAQGSGSTSRYVFPGAVLDWLRALVAFLSACFQGQGQIGSGCVLFGAGLNWPRLPTALRHFFSYLSVSISDVMFSFCRQRSCQ